MIDIQSDTQTLIIQQPAGNDLAVWNLLQQTSGAGWSVSNWIDAGATVAPIIRSTYPSSSYVAWVAAIAPLTRTSFADNLSLLDNALAANPPAALRDELLLAKGGLLQGWSEYAISNERDADKALTLADQARAVLHQSSDVALTDFTRKQATDALAKLLVRSTAIDDLHFFAEHDPPAPNPVMPRVECVQPGTGHSFTARFGYDNPNHGLKVLQIGPDNQVTPAPRDAGQPRVFKPGKQSSVFVAASPEGNLKWHLDGNEATSTASFATRCTP
jgi:hypothetical protein